LLPPYKIGGIKGGYAFLCGLCGKLLFLILESILDINEIRKRIDLLDDVLLRIFNERARLALEIGHHKKQLNLPVYDPSREKRIFARMKEDNPGPLDDGAIVRLFERVIDESRRLERIRSHGETEEEPPSK